MLSLGAFSCESNFVEIRPSEDAEVDRQVVKNDGKSGSDPRLSNEPAENVGVHASQRFAGLNFAT